MTSTLGSAIGWRRFVASYGAWAVAGFLAFQAFRGAMWPSATVPSCTEYVQTIACAAPPSCYHAPVGGLYDWCETVVEGSYWCCEGTCQKFQCQSDGLPCSGLYGVKYWYLSGPKQHRACPYTIPQCGLVPDADCQEIVLRGS